MARCLLILSLFLCAACSRRPTDEWIATQIKAAFYADAAVKQANLSVSVKDGEVTLAGAVPSADVQLRAFKLAYATHGVNAIRDDMRIVAVASAFLQRLPASPPLAKGKPSFAFPPERIPAAVPPPMIVPVPPDVLVRGDLVRSDQEEMQPEPSRAERSIAGQSVGQNFRQQRAEVPPANGAAAEFPSNGLDVTQSPAGNLHLIGAGALGPTALYQKWFKELEHANSGIQVNYQNIGSGAGIRQLIEREVDFASVERTIADQQLKPGQPKLIHIPLMIHAVVPVLNLPGATEQLKIPREALAKIYLGEITMWNDAMLAEANPDIHLPRRQIIVVHRSDGASSTQLWSAFLSKVSPEWQHRVGANDAVNWPTGMGGKGDEGVLALVARTQYSIGYAEFSSAGTLQKSRNDIRVGLMQNAAGNYVEAGPHSMEAATSGALGKSDVAGRMSILDSAAKDAYPVAGFEWLVFPDRTTDEKRKAVAVLLQWLFTRPQRDVELHGYFALPEGIAKVYRSQIKL